MDKLILTVTVDSRLTWPNLVGRPGSWSDSIPVVRHEAIEKRLAFGQYLAVIPWKAPCECFVFHRNIALKSGGRHFAKKRVEIDLPFAEWWENDVFHVAGRIFGMHVNDMIFQCPESLDGRVAADVVMSGVKKHSKRIETLGCQ